MTEGALGVIHFSLAGLLSGVFLGLAYRFVLTRRGGDL